MKIDDLVNVGIFVNPGERMVQSQEDQVEEGEFLKWFPLVLLENQRKRKQRKLNSQAFKNEYYSNWNTLPK